MKRLILTILLLSLSLSSWAQSGIVKVEGGKVVQGQFFFDKLYVFDTYQDGRIAFDDGDYYTGLININTLSQTVRIISQEGDTIRINKEKNVAVVSAGKNFFRKVNNFYVQFLNTDGNISLGLVRKMVIGGDKIEGAYGGTSETSSVSKIATLEDDSRFDRITSVSSNVEYFYDELAYLLFKNKMLIATKRNFEKAFPKQKKLIGNYIKENNTKFSEINDVILLFNYLIANR